MDLNVVVFSGRLGQDPEMRYTPNEVAVVNFSMAVNVAKEKAIWLDVTAWRKTAENVQKYLKKGSRVAVSGRLDQDQWTAEDGTIRKKFKVIASRVQFLDPPSQNVSDSQPQTSSASVGPLQEEVPAISDDNDFPL